ncbi:MAG: glycine cleavage system protein GcvH [Cytophagales bacterium]|nr:glycine cleavage system protein GcvH [Cytophagales bacterium]
MSFPADLKYSKDHEWIKTLPNNEALVGITDFAQGELGDIVFVDINTVGKSVQQFDIFGTVEAVKTVSDLFLPVSGTINEINAAINAKPELVNTDPYGEGWIVKIKMTNPNELNTLLSAEQYAALVSH